MYAMFLHVELTSGMNFLYHTVTQKQDRTVCVKHKEGLRQLKSTSVDVLCHLVAIQLLILEILTFLLVVQCRLVSRLVIP